MSLDISRQMLDFIDASPTCYHAAANIAKELLTDGYRQLLEGEA